MLYLIVSIALIGVAIAFYVRARIQQEPLPTGTKVTLGVFLGVGIIMTYFSIKEIEPYQYERVETIAQEFPDLRPMIAERKPTIQRYEYLEILEAETHLKKTATP